MKHKKSGIFKRTAISVMAAVCALSSATALSANAASVTKEEVLPKTGYVVNTTATYSGTEVTSKGRVASGSPTKIVVWGTGYFNTKSNLKTKAIKEKKSDSAVVLTSNPTSVTSGDKAIGCKAKAEYNNEGTCTAKAGYTG